MLLPHNAGDVFEGDIFSVLKHSPIVVRASEFGLADGALDCLHRHDPRTSFAARFWATDQRQRSNNASCRLLLFEAKSTIRHASYSTFTRQRDRVAFYIGVCEADPRFVDLIPNWKQKSSGDEPPGLLPRSKRKNVTVNVSRTSRVSSQAYTVDQSQSPYRMPRYMLSEAVERILQCVTEDRVYVNPWTLTEFPTWKPHCTTAVRFLKPDETSDQYSAFEAAMEIYRMTTFKAHKTHMRYDFIGVQPSLADFKFVLLRRQVLVQHKLDGKERKEGSFLSNVGVLRQQGNNIRYYFSNHDRFDFFFFQFSFSERRTARIVSEFFFIPERIIPDHFYDSLDKEQNFEVSGFSKFRISMDDDGDWVHRIKEVIDANPEPRRPGARPCRVFKHADTLEGDGPLAPEDKSLLDNSIIPSSDNERGVSKLSHAHIHKMIMNHGHRRFFEMLMTECARRRSGLLVVLAPGHPMGDFAFCRYRWSIKEQEAFAREERPPRLSHQLSPHTPCVPLTFYVRHRECSFQGPEVTAPQFRRLNSSPLHRLTVWDLLGPEGNFLPILPAVIPSDDISPTQHQRDVFNANLSRDKTRKNRKDTPFADDKTPPLSAILKTGILASQYIPETRGPQIYDGGDWSGFWTLMSRFVGSSIFQHPIGVVRQPELYRHTLQTLNQCLLNDYVLSDQQVEEA
ncbi:hypothetical protein D6D11_08328 [Aureobasidium pullulans]|nr:hypothetical protein D6D11_08328 [Aureobasidium pullulans]